MSQAVGILSVGEELLAGDIQDTNARFIARAVAGRGHRVIGMVTAGDDVGAIAKAVRLARVHCDWLLVTGGLGPTADDITRQGVAAALGRPLEERPELVEALLASGRPLTAGGRVQAVIPEGAEVLANPRGTAPGFLLREGDLAVACFPGVPSELRPMLEALLDAELDAGAGVRTRRLQVCGLTESTAGDRLADLMDEEVAGCRVGITAKLGVMTISVRGEDAAAMDRVVVEARERLGRSLFGEGDVTLAQAVVAMLTERSLTVSTAESCTGGLLAGAITAVPGSSDVFCEGVVTYSNEAKARRLGVPEPVLAEHGAVSEPVAAAMAEGQRERSGADVALSITGIAGPDGGTPAKPVGTVVFGLADAAGTEVRTLSWKGGRDEIRARSVALSLDMLRRRLGEL